MPGICFFTGLVQRNSTNSSDHAIRCGFEFSLSLLERWDPSGSETSLEQALVFDAGSSGTRPELTRVKGRDLNML